MASRVTRFSGRMLGSSFETGKDQIEVNYEDMRKYTKMFQREGDDLTQIYFVTKAKLIALKREWIGIGADKFFLQMDSIVMPSFERLCKALIETAHVTAKITRVFDDAEDLAQSEFSQPD